MCNIVNRVTYAKGYLPTEPVQFTMSVTSCVLEIVGMVLVKRKFAEQLVCMKGTYLLHLEGAISPARYKYESV